MGLFSRLFYITRLSKTHFVSLNKSFVAQASTVVLEPLKHRSILQVTGPDAKDFLQGMITNDMEVFKTRDSNTPSCLYTTLLNTKGKVLYDCLLYEIAKDTYFVEHDSVASTYLRTHLTVYRLRKNLVIKPTNMATWVTFPLNITKMSSIDISWTEKLNDLIVVPDPRLNHLGYRIIVDNDSSTVKDLNNSALLNQSLDSSYNLFRYKLGISEGVTDIPPGCCFPFEVNADLLNGMNFQKGCYIGQENSARIHFTGVVRKRVMPVTLSPDVETYPTFEAECAITNDKGKTIGKLRSHIGKHGMAVLNIADALKADSLQMKSYDFKIMVSKPEWWPAEVLMN